MLEYRKRLLNKIELKVLLKIKSSCEKELKRRIKIHYYIIALLLGLVCAYVAFKIESDFWHFVLGTIGILCLGFIVFTPYEIYKSVKGMKDKVKQVNEFVNSNEIKTAEVRATRIAVAK